jgi:hypothetical protein
MRLFSKINTAFQQGGVTLVFVRFFNKITWSFSRLHFTQHLTHRYVKPLPVVLVAYRPISQSTVDTEIAERILRAFNLARQNEQKSMTGDLWDNIQEHQHADFYAVSHDPALLAQYLSDMNRKGITYGISTCKRSESSAMLKNPTLQQEWGMYIKDTLICFAEALGAIPRNTHGDSLCMESEELIQRIEARIGISFAPSTIEGQLYALIIGGRSFVPRDGWSAYIAWRVQELVGTEVSIAEIGGGMGKAAYYAKQFGIKDYSLYDLPIINLAAAWFLIKSGVDVVLYGEEKRLGAVTILPYWEFRKGTFDLTVNVDSFPEMDASIVSDYLTTIRQNTKLLLSINREDGGVYGDGHTHIIVRDIADEVGGLKRTHRSPFWFSKNYVEELYVPQ